MAAISSTIQKQLSWHDWTGAEGGALRGKWMTSGKLCIGSQWVFKKKRGKRVNCRTENKLKEAQSALEKTAPAVERVNKGEKRFAERQKLIRLADRSDQGWATVEEYMEDELLLSVLHLSITRALWRNAHGWCNLHVPQAFTRRGGEGGASLYSTIKGNHSVACTFSVAIPNSPQQQLWLAAIHTEAES